MFKLWNKCCINVSSIPLTSKIIHFHQSNTNQHSGTHKVNHNLIKR